VLAVGAEKARTIAAVTLDRVYERTGLLARRAGRA
jgi:tryptophanyl-tRNA synthetase